MTESPVKSQPGRPPKQKIFDRNISIAWEESVLYASRNIDYVPEGEFLKELLYKNPEFSEEEIQISFRKLNEEAKRIFDENQEMIEADKPVQQEIMFWGSMAELNELETVQDREIKIWLLEHPPSQCTRKRPAPKRKLVPKEPERTDLTEEEKAARVTDLIDSVSKGEISQDYTPDSFPTLMEMRMVSNEVPPKIPKVSKVPKVPKPKEKHPLSYSKTNTIPMLLAGAQIGGPQSGPTVAEYLKTGKFAVKKHPNDPNDWVSVLQSGLASGSGSAFGSGSGLGHQKDDGPTVGEYLNQKLFAVGLDPTFGLGSALGSGSGQRRQEPNKALERGLGSNSGLALSSGLALGTASASGPPLGLGSGAGSDLQAKNPEEDLVPLSNRNEAKNQDEAPQEDQAPQPSDSDTSHQDSADHLEEDRDDLETSNSVPHDGSETQRDEVSQEDLDALRLAAGYHDLGPQYDDDGAQNYFYPEDDFFEDQGDFEPQADVGAQAQEDEAPEKELDSPGSGPQDGSQAVDGIEDPEISGSRQMAAEDHGDDLGPQEEAEADLKPEPEDNEDNRQKDCLDTSGPGSQDNPHDQEDQASDALSSGQMSVENHELGSSSDSNEDPEDDSELLEDAQRAQSPGNSGSGTEALGLETEASGLATETSGSGTEDLGSSAVVAQHQDENLGSQVQEDEYLEPEDQEADLGPGAQIDFGLQDRLGPEDLGSGAAIMSLVNYYEAGDQEKNVEPQEPEADLQQAQDPRLGDSDPATQNDELQEDQDSEPEDQAEELQDNQGPQAPELQVPDHGLDSGRQDPEDQYEDDEVDTFGLEDLDEEDSGRWGENEEEDSVYRDQEDQDPEPFGLSSGLGRHDLGHQGPQDYFEAREDKDDELKDQIELQEVQEPELPGSLVGRQDLKPQHLQDNIELQGQEYHDPDLSGPEPMDPTGPLLNWSENGNFGAQKRLRTPELEGEPQPKRFSPERGHYSGIPVWEMYQRAKKMFEDLAKKEALRSSGQLQENSEDDDEDFDEESSGSESPRASPSSSASSIPTARVQENDEDDDAGFFGSESPQSTRNSASSSAAQAPTAQVQEDNDCDHEEFFGSKISQSESPTDSSSTSAASVPTGSESPNAEEPLIYDHDYLHKVEYEIAAMQENDIIYDDVYDDDQGSQSPRNSSPIPTAGTPEALEPESDDADDDDDFSDNGSAERSRNSSPSPAAPSQASSPALEEQHIEEYNEKFSGSGSRHTSRDSSPISETSSPAHEQVNNEIDDEELLGNESSQSSRSSLSSSVAHEQGNNEEDDGELFASKSLKRSRDSTPRPATPIPEDPHNDLLKTPEPIVIAQREKTPEPPVGFPPGYEELLLNYSPFRATLKLIERQLRLPLTPEEYANLLEDARRNSMSQSSQEPKRKRSRWF